MGKTKHKPLFKNVEKPSNFITKHYKVWLAAFLILLLPAIYGNNHTEIYYNIAESLPDSLPSNVANQKLEEDFDMSNMHMILMDKNMDGLEKQNMLSEVDKIDGVKWSLNMNSLIGPSIPDSMIPDDIKKMLQSDNYELAFVCSEYGSAVYSIFYTVSGVSGVIPVFLSPYHADTL